MIKKFISRVFGRGPAPAVHESKPVIYGPDKHHIRKDHISRGARKTCEDLQRAGHSLAHQRLQDCSSFLTRVDGAALPNFSTAAVAASLILG